MSKWRNKAVDLFYDQRKEFTGPNDNIYTLFFVLIPRLKEAHANNDINELYKIYNFAEWCFIHKGTKLWNAAGVGFYEQLIYFESTKKSIPNWVKPYIFKDMLSWYKDELNPEDYKKLIVTYNKINDTNFTFN